LSRKVVSLDGDVASLFDDLDHLIDQPDLRLKVLQQGVKELALTGRGGLRDDDNQSRMQILACIEPAKVTGVVGHEGEVLGDDPEHQVPVRFTAQAQPVHMVGSWPPFRATPTREV
jgi:hypothetical protein